MSNPLANASRDVLRLLVLARQASESQGSKNVPNLPEAVCQALNFLLVCNVEYRSALTHCEAELNSFVGVVEFDRPTWRLELKASMLRQAQRNLDNARDAFELAVVQAQPPVPAAEKVGFTSIGEATPANSSANPVNVPELL